MSMISNFNGVSKMIFTIFGPIVISSLVFFRLNYQKEIMRDRLDFSMNETNPVYWVYNQGEDDSHLKHLHNVLERLGFRRGTNETDWDLLWAHNYPFRLLPGKFQSLKKHQKVNHIPGCGFITNKVDLSTTSSPYIPMAFKIPEGKDIFLQFAERFPNKSFVQKSNGHRGIQIKKIEELDYDLKDTFIQEYVDRPYLVDGHKFDIGIYTVITSIDPLRVYAYKGDALIRFCPHKYYPFDPEDQDKYIISDDYLQIWNVPSLQNYYTNLGFSMKDAFDAYVRSEGKNADKIWNNIYKAIESVTLAKEKSIAEIVKSYPADRNFFELVRFDFILDEDLKVYIMEANMSPNLSAAHNPRNRLLYEQVLFNLFALIGIGHRFHSFYKGTSIWKDRDMEVAEKNLVVLPEVCSSCLDCFRVECQLCKPCFTYEMKHVLSQSYIEHQNKMDYQRIFPPPITENMTLKDYTMKNQLLVRWYQGKCAVDSSWCN